MSTETNDPIDVISKPMLDTNSMVEEFMLLANISVAEHIFKHFPECAVLRRHPVPPESNFEPFLKAGKTQVQTIYFFLLNEFFETQISKIYFFGRDSR